MKVSLNEVLGTALTSLTLWFCRTASPTDLLADLHVFLEAVDCFSGHNRAGGTQHLTPL